MLKYRYNELDNYDNNYSFKSLTKSMKLKDENKMLSISNNGFYYSVKGTFNHIVYIDIHSMYPFIAYKNGLLNKEMENKFKEKIKIDNYLSLKNKDEYDSKEYLLLAEREKLKKELNIWIADDKKKNKKENYYLRTKIVGLSTEFMSDLFSLFDKNRIVQIVCDGFYYSMLDSETVEDIKNKLDKFKEKEDNKYLSFEMKEYDKIVINNINDFILFNKDNNKIKIKGDKVMNEKINFDYKSKNLNDELYEMIKSRLGSEYIDERNENKLKNPKFFKIIEIEKNKWNIPILSYYGKVVFNNEKDYSYLLNDGYEFKTHFFGNVKVEFLMEKPEDLTFLRCLKYFMIKSNQDLRLLDNQFKEWYKFINNHYFENEDDFDEDILTLTRVIEMVYIDKKIKSEDINERIKKIERESKANNFNKLLNMSKKDLINILDESPFFSVYNNKPYFFVENCWSNDEESLKDFIKKETDNENISFDVFNTYWKKNSNSILNVLENYISKMNAEDDRRKNENCWVFNNGRKAKIIDGKIELDNLNNNFDDLKDFSSKKFPWNFEQIKKADTVENREKVKALLLHLAGGNEKKANMILTILSMTICYNKKMRKNMNIIPIFVGKPGCGKSTLMKIVERAIGNEYLKINNELKIKDNLLNNFINVNSIVFDDPVELSKVNARIDNKLGIPLQEFRDGREKTVKILYKNLFKVDFLLTPIILTNYVPRIQLKGLNRRTLIIEIPQKLKDNENYLNKVSIDDVENNELAKTMLMMMLERNVEIENDIKNGVVKNDEMSLLKHYYDVENNDKIQSDFLNKNNYSIEIQFLLDEIGVDNFDYLINMPIINVYKFYIEKCNGKFSKDKFIEEIESMGYHLGRLNKRSTVNNAVKITCSNVILSNNNKKNNNIFKQLKENVVTNNKLYGSDSASLRSYSPYDLIGIKENLLL